MSSYKFLLLFGFLLNIAISATITCFYFHSLFLSILMSLLSSLVSTWSFLDNISALVFVFLKIIVL